MLGSFFDLRREVEAIAARRERDAPPAEASPAIYEEFDHKVHAFLRSLKLGQADDPSTEIKLQGTPFAPR